MEFLQAIILGLIEGFTEFLPISSTGHLIIAEKLFGISNTSSFFTTFIQVGAIFAAAFFFRARFRAIYKDSLMFIKDGMKIKTASKNQLLGMWIIISIIPTLVIAFIFRKQVEEWQNSAMLVAITTILFGVLFYYFERLHKKKISIHKDINNVTLKNLIVMGFFQAVAIIPGVSRSGITISGGMLQNIKIKDSIEVSFIMGVPVIIIASLYKLVSSISGLTPSIIISTILGTATAFIVGLYSIRLTLGILQRKGFYPFMIYRIFLGLAVLLLIFTRVIQ